MGTLGVGIIGCGWVAGEYVKAFHEDERAEIRALVSRQPANAQRYRDAYDLHCAIETDATAMLDSKDIDIVVVSTPHDVHTPFVVAAAIQPRITVLLYMGVSPRYAMLARGWQAGMASPWHPPGKLAATSGTHSGNAWQVPRQAMTRTWQAAACPMACRTRTL